MLKQITTDLASLRAFFWSWGRGGGGSLSLLVDDQVAYIDRFASVVEYRVKPMR